MVSAPLIVIVYLFYYDTMVASFIESLTEELREHRVFVTPYPPKRNQSAQLYLSIPEENVLPCVFAAIVYRVHLRNEPHTIYIERVEFDEKSKTRSIKLRIPQCIKMCGFCMEHRSDHE